VASKDKKPERENRETVTFRLPPSLIEKARDAAYWERLTLSGLMEEALAAKIASLEKKNGQPFAKRERDLMPTGRPRAE